MEKLRLHGNNVSFSYQLVIPLIHIAKFQPQANIP